MRRGDRIALWGGALVIVWAVLVRLMTIVSRTPWWDLDPTRSTVPESTLTPALSLLLDVVVWLAAGVVFWGARRALTVRDGITLALVLIGAMGCALHAYIFPPLIARGGSADGGWWPSLVLGSSWASALVGAWALSIAARERGPRRLLGAILLGVGTMLIAKGAHQILFEHPELIRQFEADPDSALRAAGIEPGSASAQLYERRMRHADATGWTGLSNAYASIVAAILVAACALCWSGTRLVRRGALSSGEAGIIGIFAVLCATALWLAHSKGAWGALILGLIVLEVLERSARGRALLGRHARSIVIILPGLVLLGVVVRGLLGERLGELSILFRWHYMQGAARLIVEHPIVGVGPASFKDAYLGVRPPISPEEVESPHSLPFDWLATLGVFALAWLALVIHWVRSAGAGLASSPGAGVDQDEAPDTMDGEDRGPLLPLVIVVLGACLASWWVGWGAMPATEMLLLVVGAGLWIIIAAVLMRLGRRDQSAMPIAMALAGLTLIVHSMIEVTLVLQSTAAWGLALLGVASASCARAPTETTVEGRDSSRGSIRPGVVSATVLVLIAMGLIHGVLSVPRAIKWENALRAASAQVRPFAELTGAVRAMPTDPRSIDLVSRQRLNDAMAEAAILLGRSPPASSEEWGEFLVELEAHAKGPAIEHLREAHEIIPSSLTPLTRAAGLEFDMASSLWLSGESQPAEVALDRAVTTLRVMTEEYPGRSTGWANLATMLEAIADLTGDEGARREAIGAWERVVKLDPFALEPQIRLARLHQDLGDSKASRDAASRALEINELKRLDPLRQLSDRERRELARIIEGPG